MYSDYDTSAIIGASAGSVFGFFLGFLAILLVILIPIIILNIIGTWKILKKANKPGWGALVPIYNQYLLCQIAGVNPWWILIMCLCPIVNLIPILGSIAVMAAYIYFAILLYVSLARSFGKEDGFAVGLILLNPIFSCILGFGSSQYVGPRPMKDIIFKNNDNMQSNSSPMNQAPVNSAPMNPTPMNQDPNVGTQASTESNTKFCTSCGSQIDANTRFCPNCGKETN